LTSPEYSQANTEERQRVDPCLARVDQHGFRDEEIVNVCEFEFRQAPGAERAQDQGKEYESRLPQEFAETPGRPGCPHENKTHGPGRCFLGNPAGRCQHDQHGGESKGKPSVKQGDEGIREQFLRELFIAGE
jgi:hypothetical protein